MQTPVLIKTYDNFGYIQVVPKDEDVAFAKGFSGSPLYIAGKASGMLLSVKNGVGRVLRQDALNNILALFFQSEGGSAPSEQPARVSTSQSTVNPEPEPQQVVDNTRKTKTDAANADVSELDNALASQQPVTGKISEGQIITYSFNCQKNSPILFRFVKKSGRDYYQPVVLNSRKDVVAKCAWVGRRNYEWSFTPPEDGTYTLQMTGGDHHDEYELELLASE